MTMLSSQTLHATQAALYRVELIGGPFDGYSEPWILTPPPELHPPVLTPADSRRRVAEYELASTWLASIEPPVVLIRYRFRGFSKIHSHATRQWLHRFASWARARFQPHRDGAENA